MHANDKKRTHRQRRTQIRRLRKTIMRRRIRNIQPTLTIINKNINNKTSTRTTPVLAQQYIHSNNTYKHI